MPRRTVGDVDTTRVDGAADGEGGADGARLGPLGVDTAQVSAAQVVGGCVGAVIANVMFELPAFEVSTHVRSSGALWFSEIVATIGLLLVIHGCVRSGRGDMVAVAVGVWIGGAYWFTSSTSFANPAVTVGRTLSNTFAGIAPSSAPAFVVAQVVGGLIALGAVLVLYPRPRPRRQVDPRVDPQLDPQEISPR